MYTFCNRRLSCPDPYLTLGRDQIIVVKELKFLGLTFDSRLSFIPYLRNLRSKTQKAVGLIKVVAAKGWGADRHAKPTLYRALVDTSWTMAKWFTTPLGHRISRCSIRFNIKPFTCVLTLLEQQL